jgi:hypothetical protein
MEFDIYRRMTPLQRLQQASQLYASARQLRTAVERQKHPEWTELELQAHVTRVFLLATT